MAYKVYVEVIPRPDNVDDWKWNQIQERRGTPQNGHAVWKSHTGGYAWKVTGSSYNNEDDADTKKELPFFRLIPRITILANCKDHANFEKRIRGVF